VIRNPDGSTYQHYKMKYDENGNFIKILFIKPDGSEVESHLITPSLDESKISNL
jgi:hypothetical protein